MAKLKKGQSKYMPHLRVTKSVGSNKQVLGRAARVGHVPNSGDNEYGIVRTEEELKTKGKYGGLCNRSCCLRREAYWWNRGSRAHYCEGCAALINEEFRHRDDVENYGSLLVQPPTDVDVIDFTALGGDHEKPWGIQHSNGNIAYFDTEEQACDAQRHFRHVVGLRSDGSNPLWFTELSARYEQLRGMVTIKNSW